MGPPGFMECFVCHREYGSRSIEIHWPQCLHKWKSENDSLPKSRREDPPAPSTDHPLYEAYQNSIMTPSLEAQTLSNSWPDARGRPMMSKKYGRPSTATLDKPKVLDITLRDVVDMSELTRDMMANMDLTSSSSPAEQMNTSSDYSSDFASSSPSSLGSKSPLEDDNDPASVESESETKKRPSTRRIARPSRHIKVPVIKQDTITRRGTTATIRSFLPRGRRKPLDEAFTGPKIPEPCLTCGKEQNPERFHSHPKHLVKFKAKDSKQQQQQQPQQQPSKLPVTKPTALKYRSSSLEGDKLTLRKGNKKQSKLKPPVVYSTRKSKSQRNSKSVENSPEGARKSSPSNRKPEKKLPIDSLKKFIEKRKASMNKKPKAEGIEIEIFTGEKSPTDLEEIPIGSKVKINSKPKKKLKPKGDTSDDNDDVEIHIASAPKSPVLPKKDSENDIENKNKTISAPTRVCYICGREFGSRSLNIHQPQCLEKWKRENEQLPKHLQRPEPIPPEKDLSRDEMNEYAWNTAQALLVPCDNCGRTFFPERLEVHQRGCQPKGGTSGSKQARPDTTKSAAQEPTMSGPRPTVICYICGREFGSRSIAIHEPQCLRKWQNENDKLPEHLQRPPPEKPEVILNDEGKIDKDAMADVAWQSHLKTLIACEGCGRTFFPDRLEKHQNSCKSMA